MKKILIINSAEPEVKSFTDPIAEELEGSAVRLELREWRELRGLNEIDPCDAVIISASPRGDNANFEERIQSFQWLKNTEIPVLGICAGHQFIGSVFGSELIREKEKEVGRHMVRVLSRDPVFEGFSNCLAAEQQHHDSITLPEKFVLLASSDRCRVQAIRHKERLIYGFQWHVEVSSRKLLSNYAALV